MNLSEMQRELQDMSAYYASGALDGEQGLIEHLCWNPQDPDNIPNTYLKVFHREIEQTWSVLRQGKSVLIYCERRVAAHIGASLARMAESRRGDGIESAMEFGRLARTGPGVRTVREALNVLLENDPRQGHRDLFIVYNADILGTYLPAGGQPMQADFLFNVLEKSRLDVVFVLFVDPDFGTFPKLFEKHFEVIRIRGIPTPAALLPVLTLEELDTLLDLRARPGGLRSIRAEGIPFTPEALVAVHRLYSLLSGFTPEQVRRIVEVRPQGLPLPDAVLESRNDYLQSSTDLNTATAPNVAPVQVPWLADVKERIVRLLEYSMKYGEANPFKGIRGLILYGPPGNGKTMLVRCVCQEKRVNHIIVGAQDIKSRYLGDSEKAICDLFRRAGQASPCVLVFDEMEALFVSRDRIRDESTGMQGIVTTLLREMDSIGSQRNVLVVGMTNRMPQVDEGFIRPGRFDEAIEIPYPNPAQVSVIIDYFLELLYEPASPFRSPANAQKLQRCIAGLTPTLGGSGRPISVAEISHIVKMLELEHRDPHGDDDIQGAVGSIFARLRRREEGRALV